MAKIHTTVVMMTLVNMAQMMWQAREKERGREVRENPRARKNVLPVGQALISAPVTKIE